MPLFTWQPISGYQSYYVVVATDDQFQNVVDYAWTQVPAYAPRAGLSGFTDYSDATYYWAVLPATGFTGTGVSARPDLAPAETFQRQSDAPTLTSPSDGDSISTWPVFQWTPVDGAYDYHLQVATDQNFSNIVTGGDVHVDETSYTPASTYPAGQVLYWRVQAEAKGSLTAVGLKWSAKGTFTKTLPVPSFTTPDVISNPGTSDGIPIWRWNPVPGAVSYDITLNCPSGSQCSNGVGFDTTAVVATHLTGTKPLTWQVRANFPTVNNGNPSTAPCTGRTRRPSSFQRTISAPANPVTAVAEPHQLLDELGSEGGCEAVPGRGLVQPGGERHRRVQRDGREDHDRHDRGGADSALNRRHDLPERRHALLACRGEGRGRQRRLVHADPDAQPAGEARGDVLEAVDHQEGHDIGR